MDLKKYLVDAASTAQEAADQYDTDMAAQKAAGIEEGRGQIVLPSEGTGEKLYTQEDLAKAVSDMEANKQAEVDQVTADLQRAKEAAAEATTGHEVAIKALKKEFAEGIRSAEVDNMALADKYASEVEEAPVEGGEVSTLSKKAKK